MPEYPQINQGLGKLSPDLWNRMMKSLRDFEIYADAMGLKVRDRTSRRSPKAVPSNLVQVKNTGSTATIYKLEACVDNGDANLQPIVFAQNLLDCQGCTSSTCAYGPCGSWPGSAASYKDIYDVALTVPIVFQVISGAEQPNCIPKPGTLREVFVAAQDIPPGETGWAYQNGMHYAWVFDPRGISTNGSDAFYNHEFLYADLPDYDFWHGRDNYDICNGEPDGEVTSEGFPAYSSDPNNGNGCSGITVSLPLMIRPQGRYKVHWLDMLTSLYLPSFDGDGTMDWPIAYHNDDGSINTYPKIRMGLVEKMPQWQVPQIKARIKYYDRYINSSGVSQNLRFRYEWDYILSGTYDDEVSDIFNGWRVGDATNLAEHHNCECTGLCENCLDGGVGAHDTNNYAGGVQIEKLDHCFGVGQWTLLAAAGFSCHTELTGKQSEVMLTMGIDKDGKQEPSFTLQNAVQAAC